MTEIFYASLKCIAISVMMKEGELLFKLRQLLDRIIPISFRKPIYECLACMASVWGTVFYFTDGITMNYFQFILILCGWNYLTGLIIHLIRKLLHKDEWITNPY
jgi:hypothetical protein